MVLRKLAVVGFSLVSIGLCLFFAGCQFDQPRKPVAEAGREPIIRVQICGASQTIPLAVDGPFTILGRGGQKLYQGAALANSEVRLEGDGLRVGSQRIAFDEYCDVVPQYDGALAVNHRYYHGSLRLHRTASGQLYAVNHLKTEDYLKGVLPGELPKRFSLEAFKAQAIAARTFALYEKMTSHERKTWDVMNNESSQMYVGKSGETDMANQAVQATAAIVLAADMPGRGWKIFPAYYSSTCGGWTQPSTALANINPAIKPLMAEVRCDGCAISPRRNWDSMVVSLADVAQSINQRGLAPRPISRITSIRVLERTAKGHITKVEMTDSAGQRVMIPGQKFRLAVGSRRMPSTLCDVRVEGDNVVFYNGHGLGHACGMCQWGAEGMARKGYTAKEILLHYYPQARLIRAY
jgi:stage II sporulation protein D